MSAHTLEQNNMTGRPWNAYGSDEQRLLEVSYRAQPRFDAAVYL